MLKMPHPNPSGLCMCECGMPTPLARQTDYSRGLIKGLPIRFIHNHHGRQKVRYVEVDQGYITPCWIWQLHIDRDGYGVAHNGRDPVKAYRKYYEKKYGKVPDGLVLDHLCHDRDTCEGGRTCPHRACMNPDHVSPKTSRENTERGSHCKISREDLPEIRALRATGMTYREISFKFGVSAMVIHGIIRGTKWKDPD